MAFFTIVMGQFQSFTLVKVKTSDTNPTKNFNTFKNYFSNHRMVQLVQNITQEKTFPDGVEVIDLGN